MIGFFRPRPRSFSYIPRYYSSAQDRRERIRFERKTLYDPHTRRMSNFTFLLLIVLAILLINFIIPRLSSIRVDKTKISTEDIIVRQPQ